MTSPPNNSMKPTTYRAGFQRLAAVGVNSWRAHLASAGGGLSRPLAAKFATEEDRNG